MDIGIATSTRPPLSGYLDRLLKELRTVLVERGSTYSDFEDNSGISQSLRRALSPFGLVPAANSADDMVENGLEMIRAKLSRLACSGYRHRDSWMDLAGYALLIAACQDRDTEHAGEPPMAQHGGTFAADSAARSSTKF